VVAGRTSTGEALRDLDGELADRAEIVATVQDEAGRIIVKLRVLDGQVQDVVTGRIVIRNR
jgi:hypothetical protein